MRESTILASLIEFEEPDNGRKQNDWRFHEEVTLLLYPCAVEVKHDGISRLVGIGNVSHKVWVNWITPVASARVIKVDDIELGENLIAGLVCKHVIVGNGTKVTKLVVVDVHREAFFNGLLDEVVHYGVGLTTTWRTEYV